MCVYVQEIESLRVNVSALQQRVMELQVCEVLLLSVCVRWRGLLVLLCVQSPSSDPTMAPVEVAQFADIRVVNYSECQSVRRHCNISDSTASCAVNIPMPPEVQACCACAQSTLSSSSPSTPSSF